MADLLGATLSLGWPVLLFLACLLVYFQFSMSDPDKRRRAQFKTFIGMLAAAMAFMAIANYKLNFFGNSRLLPVSLVMITALAFMMGLYFANVSALFKIGGMMFLVAAALSGYGNWLPQVEGGFPPPEVKLDFGSMFLSERAPNLFGIPDRAKKQLEDPKYHKGKPGDRDTTQKESFPGAGTAETGQEYIAESHACPSCYVVAGFGVKGTNDKESPMPAIHKPPISLTLGELAAVDTWLYVREGKEAPTFEDITKAYEKFIPEADRPKPQEDKPAAGAGGLLADGSEPLDQIFAKAQCVVCHTIPGIPGAMGTVGPKLVEKTNAPTRIKDPAYKGSAKTVRDYITESVISPSTYVVKPFPDGVMPKVFGQKLSAGALNKIVDYLSQIEEGKAPPKI